MSGTKSDRLCKTISIPRYMKNYVDDRIDLVETPKIPCPFHDDHSPSFTYSADKGLWRCWSNPDCGGGDVIHMHLKNYKLSSREDAIESLARLLGVDLNEIDFSEKTIKVDQTLHEYAMLQVVAERRCKGPSDWVALDYIMSQRRPVFEMVEDLKNFVELKGGISNERST